MATSSVMVIGDLDVSGAEVRDLSEVDGEGLSLAGSRRAAAFTRFFSVLLFSVLGMANTEL